jgi:hypothetical protein
LYAYPKPGAKDQCLFLEIGKSLKNPAVNPEEKENVCYIIGIDILNNINKY